MPIGINCDMGESFGIYKMGNDAAIMPFVTIANVACGFHASDPTVMAQTVQLAKRHKVKVGAHPSLPDLAGFGRREMKMHPDEITDCIIYQVGALRGFLEREGMPLNHIKPHGALYGMACAFGGSRARHRKRRHRFSSSAVWDVGHASGRNIYGQGRSLHRGILRRSRLRHGRQPDHHAGACGG